MSKICTNCVMDTSAKEIRFDSKGVCNFCYNYYFLEKNIQINDTYNPKKLHNAIETMKKLGQNHEYDCIIGLSGGLDSSYLCHILYKLNVRPLVIHVDNGWNSKTAEHNIQCIIDKTKFAYERIKCDVEEFIELQKAYFRASVCDVEVLTDHAMMALLYKKAEEYDLKYVIIGDNYATELTMPNGWNFNKSDFYNIKDIIEKNSTITIKNYPFYNTADIDNKFIRIAPLNYEKYIKNKATAILQKEYGWKAYPYKHYESIFTCFYQAYYLPVKFGFDKRRSHFSDLIHSNQMKRRDALIELTKPACSGAALEHLKSIVIKKLGFSKQEWEYIMQAKPVSHFDYATAPYTSPPINQEDI